MMMMTMMMMTKFGWKLFVNNAEEKLVGAGG